MEAVKHNQSHLSRSISVHSNIQGRWHHDINLKNSMGVVHCVETYTFWGDGHAEWHFAEPDSPAQYEKYTYKVCGSNIYMTVVGRAATECAFFRLLVDSSKEMLELKFENETEVQMFIKIE